MRDSIWSAPAYDDEEEARWDALMEEARARAQCRTDYLLTKAFKAIPGDNWQEKLDHCLKCKCCTRHQVLRPKRLEPWTEDMAEVDIKIKWMNTECECSCRHMARFICRQCDDDGNFLPCPTNDPITETPM